VSARPGQSIFLRAMLVLGFAFLYAPILSLVVYSFNESKLVTVWAGFSVKWYGELFRDQGIMDAAWVSIRIAFFTACASVVLATIASMVMTRFRPFRGKTLFGALITAPLVMPEVITGLSILLLFVSFGIARGMTTIWIAHVTFCVSFVAVVVSSRLGELDKSIEEAAMDLGANRVQVFFQITLPIIMPALVSGWLLAFTISLDDVVIAQFVSGPGSTTLPMEIFSKVRLGVSPDINALATIIIGIVALGVFVATLLQLRRPRAARG
jgi:putrescine transport system permease protein